MPQTKIGDNLLICKCMRLYNTLATIHLITQLHLVINTRTLVNLIIYHPFNLQMLIMGFIKQLKYKVTLTHQQLHKPINPLQISKQTSYKNQIILKLLKKNNHLVSCLKSYNMLLNTLNRDHDMKELS